MSTTVATKEQTTGTEIAESVITKGDLAKLTPQERTRYYVEVCNSVGLNPLTKPFEYITLNGKLTLYALRNCTDQLRTIHNVSVEELAESEREGVFIVTAKVKNSQGRTDIAKGAVTISSLKGDALANAMMKAETKAKRRATLSICGLGFLDESEIETIPAFSKAAPRPAPQIACGPIEAPHDPETGEIGPHAIKVPMIADDSGSDWLTWGGKFVVAIKTARSLPELDRWVKMNDAALKSADQDAPKVYERVKANINDALTRLKADSPSAPAAAAE